ncbi:MAG: VWA domain-containing protein [Pirellulaceae bacterium]|nr:VWA domain-containing protein [Pirellulaceae bacterium]
MKRENRKRREGATLVLLCLLLPVVLGIAAYSINVVYMELARTELQITTDVATRAAGRTLAVTGSQQQAILAAERLMQANPFANQTMSLNGSDIVFGISTRQAANQRYNFVSGTNPNAVHIKANGKVKVPMLFPTMGVPIEFRPIKTAICTQTELDVALVIDRSGSMAYGVNEVASHLQPPAAAPPGWSFGQPVPPMSRWQDAVASVDSFLQLLTKSSLNEHVSLSTYSSDFRTEVPLTSNFMNIGIALANNSARFYGGATNVGDGILTGMQTLGNKQLARPWASRVMIVLTDGIHNTGTDPLYAAKIAAQEDIMIFTITFSMEADVARMQQVAEAGSGRHFHATSAAELNAAFKEIANRLPTLITY